MWRRHHDGHEGLHGGRRERVFDRGDFKYVLLDLLQERPGHGYELIRRLEERFGGRYAPSPGVVYPALQLLEDMGCVEVTREDGRKVYTITDAGRSLLAERGERVEDIRERMQGWHDAFHESHLHHAMHGLRELGQFLKGRGNNWSIDADKARRIGEVVTRARQDIEAILAEPPVAAAGAARETRPPAADAATGGAPPQRRPDML